MPRRSGSRQNLRCSAHRRICHHAPGRQETSAGIKQMANVVRTKDIRMTGAQTQPSQRGLGTAEIRMADSADREPLQCPLPNRSMVAGAAGNPNSYIGGIMPCLSCSTSHSLQFSIMPWSALQSLQQLPPLQHPFRFIHHPASDHLPEPVNASESAAIA